jgi:V/A-type H+-transporting ATPase subunit K
MKKRVAVIAVVLFALAGPVLFAQEAGNEGGGSSIKYIAAAIAVGIACIGGGIAVGQIGAAAMGAMSENAELSGKAMPFVGLAEGICLWGFLVALLIMIL